MSDIEKARVATRNEVDDLKTQWLENPHWSIEGTGGIFTDHHAELLAFSNEKKEQWKVEDEAADKEKLEKQKAREIEVFEKFRNLKLHQSLGLSDELSVTRVFGGWLYETRIELHNHDEALGWAVTTSFVPYTTQRDLNVMIDDAIKSM